MKRQEILRRLQMETPAAAQKRVVVVSDVKNEADDAFAVAHHLLTPSLDVRGIVAAHFESKAPGSCTTMERSYEELCTLLRALDMEDVPALRGCVRPLAAQVEAPESEGARFIVREALRADERPLHIAAQGALTDVAAALNLCPAIAEKLIVVWIGGGPYPQGRKEFNLKQDIPAARAVFASAAEVWQVPQNVYAQMEVTLAELARRVRPCGGAGAYLYGQLERYNAETYRAGDPLHSGENWCLGDQPTVSVLLQSSRRGNFHTETAPLIQDDMTYRADPHGKPIRVYDRIDARMTFEDFYAKLALCYPAQ
jgi:inosine-uridine nucleoside N-ribohydrolase